MESATSSGQSALLSVLPILILSVVSAIVANLLAREKGRRVAVWTALWAIPIINFTLLPRITSRLLRGASLPLLFCWCSKPTSRAEAGPLVCSTGEKGVSGGAKPQKQPTK